MDFSDIKHLVPDLAKNIAKRIEEAGGVKNLAKHKEIPSADVIVRTIDELSCVKFSVIAEHLGLNIDDEKTYHELMTALNKLLYDKKIELIWPGNSLTGYRIARQ